MAEITHLSRSDCAENVDDAVGFLLPLLWIFFAEQSAAARKTQGKSLVIHLFKCHSRFWHEKKVRECGPRDPDVIHSLIAASFPLVKSVCWSFLHKRFYTPIVAVFLDLL